MAVPLLMAGLGTIEIAQWFYVKQAVSLALLQAGRAGITEHADPKAIESAFEQALLPLYARSSVHSAKESLRRALEQRSEHLSAPWQIEVLSPMPAAFLDFSDTALSTQYGSGLAAINNNYQFEQNQRKHAQGWPGGRGPHSNQTIYQANTLVLRLTYLHEPALPGMKSLIRMLAPGNGTYGSLAMARGGYLPLKQEMALNMQSHPVNWPMPSRGKVIHKDNGQGDHAAGAACVGLWCLGRPRLGQADPGLETNGANKVERHSDASRDTQGVQLDDTSPGKERIDLPWPDQGSTDPGSAPEGLGVAENDPACGVTLCCLAG